MEEEFRSCRVMNIRNTGEMTIETDTGDDYHVSIRDMYFIDRDMLRDVVVSLQEWIGSVIEDAQTNGERYPFVCTIETNDERLKKLQVDTQSIPSELCSDVRERLRIEFGHSEGLEIRAV